MSLFQSKSEPGPIGDMMVIDRAAGGDCHVVKWDVTELKEKCKQL